MALISIAVIPFGPEIDVFGHDTWMQLTDLNIGVLFVLAVSSMGVYGIALAGWASNNKYSLLGGLRSSAQMISYELPLALAIAAPLLHLQHAQPARDGGERRRVHFGHPAQLDHLPAAVSAGLRLHHFPDRGVRRNQPHPVRPAGSRKRTRRRLPHRVQQHEVRRVLHGRIRQHGHRQLDGDAAVPGRLACRCGPRHTAPSFVPVDSLRDGRRRSRFYHGMQPGAPLRPLHAARCSA